jgi:hypothetical protein
MTPAPDHAPSFYLSDEANSARMAKLIQRIATKGLQPGESVPARIMAEADRLPTPSPLKTAA